VSFSTHNDEAELAGPDVVDEANNADEFLPHLDLPLTLKAAIHNDLTHLFMKSAHIRKGKMGHIFALILQSEKRPRPSISSLISFGNKSSVWISSVCFLVLRRWRSSAPTNNHD
jgi:hypothetical protein